MSGPIRSADIAELRAFCAAVDLGSLGRAARLLRVSQPALSKRLRVLETLAGARLLDRSSRGVKPTPAGARLYAEARKLLVQAETVDALLAGLSAEDAPVRLAASHTIAEYVLPGPLVEFEQRRERHLSVELIIANSLVVRDLVREGRAEFGIAATAREAPPDSVLRELPFCDDEVVVAVPERHPWAARRSIPGHTWRCTAGSWESRARSPKPRHRRQLECRRDRIAGHLRAGRPQRDQLVADAIAHLLGGLWIARGAALRGPHRPHLLSRADR
jgi:DNA-binding transcriptional LysR family regulator